MSLASIAHFVHDVKGILDLNSQDLICRVVTAWTYPSSSTARFSGEKTPTLRNRRLQTSSAVIGRISPTRANHQVRRHPSRSLLSFPNSSHPASSRILTLRSSSSVNLAAFRRFKPILAGIRAPRQGRLRPHGPPVGPGDRSLDPDPGR